MTFQLFIKKTKLMKKKTFFAFKLLNDVFIILINVKYVYVLVINAKIPTITFVSLLCFRKREIRFTFSIIKTQTKKNAI